MDKKQAQQQISDVFTKAFDRERYTAFLRNLLNKVESRDGHYTGTFVKIKHEARSKRGLRAET